MEGRVKWEKRKKRFREMKLRRCENAQMTRDYFSTYSFEEKGISKTKFKLLTEERRENISKRAEAAKKVLVGGE